LVLYLCGVSERRERSFLRRPREDLGGGHDDLRPSEDDPMPVDEGRRDEPRRSAAGPGEADEPFGGLSHGAELRRSMSLAAERIDEIITTAQQMAEEIRREAEVEAERYLASRRRESERLVEDQLGGVRRALTDLRAELDEAEQRTLDPLLGRADPGARRADAEPPATRATAPPRPVAYPGTLASAESRERESPGIRTADEGTAALIRASQLAIQGLSRDRIADALQAEYGIERPDEIIDQILPRQGL
jgi:hypothetical protein